MPDFNNLTDVLNLLKKAQEAEHDNRIRVREVIHFLEKDDGQWEPAIISKMNNRPRYTFDKCNPVVDSIAGEMEQAEFAIRVRPAGGDATKELAKLYDGIVRNIENLSNASSVFDAAGRNMVASGFDAWRVVQDWADGDSFEQDLFIRKVANAVDRVWFDTNAEMQDMSDAKWCFVLQSLSKDEYDERFPEGSGASVGDDRESEVYSHKPAQVVVGEFLWKKPTKKELVLMSNSKVYEVNDDFKKVEKELKELGVTELKRRNRDSFKVMTRLFDGSDWLSAEKETVFKWIPIIPTYGNFKISENKVIYRGAVNKLMDPQRVYNYAKSREIEEGALAPRGKYWMTRQQAAKDQATLQTMNTNADPVQLYTHVPEQPVPFWQGGAQINSGLQLTSQDAAKDVIEASGIFAANQGNAPLQSGVAIELQQNKGDTSTIKYFKSQEVAICQTARVLVDAIPKVYDTKRQIRVLGEDGSFDMEMLNDEIFDQETQKMVSLNDLRQGKYDVTCDVGPAFKNRQQETIKAITEIAAVDPTILEEGADVLLNNIQSPGIDTLMERRRARMVRNGIIPEKQWTEEEREEIQQLIQQQQEQEANQPPDPVQQAILEQTQANTADVVSKAEERQDNALLKAEDLRIKEQQQLVNIQQQSEKQDLEELKVSIQQQTQANQQVMDNQTAIIDQLKTQAETLKILREAQGVDVIVGPHTQEGFIQQAELVTEKQDQISPTPETQPVTDAITRPRAE